MYRTNPGDRPPKKGLLARFMHALLRRSGFSWLERHEINAERMGRYGGKDQVLASDDPAFSLSKPHRHLPHADLTEEERKQAIEEIRRRPRIG